MHHGDSKAEETKPVKVELGKNQSEKKSETKRVTFPSQAIIFDITMVVLNGIPEQKNIQVLIMKVLPGGRETSIAEAVIDLS